jgi:hypothetical protein
MLKKAASKAAASEDVKSYSVPYVEPLSEARTKLGAFFSILVDKGVSVRLGSSHHD